MIWLYGYSLFEIKFENLMKSYFTKLIIMINAIASLFLNVFDIKNIYILDIFENYCKLRICKIK